MSLSPILSIIYIVTFDTMLNFNGSNEGHGLKTLRVNRPLCMDSFSNCPYFTVFSHIFIAVDKTHLFLNWKQFAVYGKTYCRRTITFFNLTNF